MKSKRILHHPHQQNGLSSHDHHVIKKRRLILQQLDSSTGVQHHHQAFPVTIITTGGDEDDDFFYMLPDDLVICILTKLSSTANSPPDFINIFATCKRLGELAHQNMVLTKANRKTFICSAKKWSDSAHRFLKLCAGSGNIEDCYVLGMISFYCLQSRAIGASLIAKPILFNKKPKIKWVVN